VGNSLNIFIIISCTCVNEPLLFIVPAFQKFTQFLHPRRTNRGKEGKANTNQIVNKVGNIVLNVE